MQKRAFLVLAVVVCLSTVVFSQSDSGRLIGTVTDPSGAAVPGASIKVTEVSTNRTVTVDSRDDGSYVVNAVPVGNYKVEASKAGFKSASAAFALDISQVKEVNFKLEIGEVSETVEVTNDIPVVDTATSDTGEVIQGRQVVDLPLNGRNFTQLALLTPGVSRGQYSNNASAPNNNAETWRNAESGGAALAVDGLRPQANNYVMDGIDNNESLVNTIVIFPAIEDIAEFKTTTTVAPAEFGRSGGGLVQVTTKSGTNDIHGVFYEFNRSKLLAADEFTENNSNPPAVVPRPELSRNQFGASLGGPIWKNKIFGFVDYQGWRQNVPAGVNQTHVPTALMRTGNFSELLSSTGSASATTVPVFQVCPNLYQLVGTTETLMTQFAAGNGYIYNPQTCLPFGWVGGVNSSQTGNTNLNMIPSTSQIQAGINYLNAFPIANIPNANIATNSPNFQRAVQNITRRDDYDARLDVVLSSKDNVFGRYSLGDDFLDNVPYLQDATHFLPSGNGTNPSRPRQVAVGYTHIFSPNILNEFHYAYERDMLGYQQPDSSVALAQSLGIVNANTSPLLGGMPIIGGWYGNLSYVGDGGPYLILEPTHQFADAVSWIKGKHTFKFGGSIIHRDVNWDQGNNAKGYFWIDDNDGGGMPTRTSGHGTFTGHEASELLAGFVGGYTVGGFSGYYQTRSWENGFFAQDDYRVSPRLTLNLGLRYDWLSWPYEASNHQSNFNPLTGELVEAGSAPGYNRSLINTPTHDLGPRFGFAYDLFGNAKTVLRGGYGLFYYVDRGGVANELSENPDFNGSQTYYACNSITGGGIDCTGTVAANSGYRITFQGQAPLGTTNVTAATAALPPKVGINPNAVTSSDNVVYWPKNSPNPNIQQWNIQVEQALDSKTALDIAYVGTHMGNLATPFNANSENVLGGSSWFPGGGAINPNGVGNINEYAMIANGRYNGLQAKLNRKTSNGLTLTVAYTLSFTKDNSADALSTAPGGVVVGNNGQPLLHYQWGNSDNDQRHLFALSALYELPFGRGKTFMHDIPKAADYVFGGWEWNNVVLLQTGTPMDIQGAVPSPNGRPDYHGGCKTGVSAFVWISCPAGAFTAPAGPVGDLPRNFFPGPGTYTWDTGIFKVISITERVKTELRMQVYNLLNTPQFQIPDTNYTNGDFGQLTSARIAPPNRELELAIRVSF